MPNNKPLSLFANDLTETVAFTDPVSITAFSPVTDAMVPTTMSPVTFVLADAAENLYPARMQMALSLGWHIVFSCLGVAFPVIAVFAEWRARRTNDPVLDELAHTWAKAMGVLFAAGAVSGTLLTFEMGILWPGLMNTYGEIFGFPFVLEGFSFFIEAIFVGIYLFGWNRMSPRAHMLSAIPTVLAGIAQVDTFVTDQAADERVVSALREHGTTVTVC